MFFIRGLHNLSSQHRGCALTIGNFDGVHLGHQALLKALNDDARELNCPSCIMTFNPLPSEYFSQTQAGARLMNTREKFNALQSLPTNLCPDNYLLIQFNQALSQMSASEFIQRILIDTLNVKSIVIGDDFRFGSDRKGNYKLLQKAGQINGFKVSALSTHNIGGMRASSTRIREALHSGDFKRAEAMMGRPYTICGRIAHGDKRGRTIGFPTANIRLHRLRSPIHGVYSVTMHTENLGNIAGIANIGKRPTVNGENFQLEVHLFDFEQDIYGENVSVSFQKKIRNEKKFDSFDDLKNQIKIDCEKARSFL